MVRGGHVAADGERDGHHRGDDADRSSTDQPGKAGAVHASRLSRSNRSQASRIWPSRPQWTQWTQCTGFFLCSVRRVRAPDVCRIQGPLVSGLVARTAGLAGVVASPDGNAPGSVGVVVSGPGSLQHLACCLVGVHWPERIEQVGLVDGRGEQGQQMQVSAVTRAVKLTAALRTPKRSQGLSGVPSDDLSVGRGLWSGVGRRVA